MTKTFLALAAVSTLTLSSALAQSPPEQPASPPGLSSGTTSGGGTSGTSGAASSDSKDAIATEKATAVQSGAGAGSLSPSGIVTGQTADQWLASKFKGTSVLGPDDNKIGVVEDLLFDRTGSIKAVVVGVGGFLGIGSKQVALSLQSFEVVPGKNGSADQLRLSMTKEQLATAPEFKPYEAPRTAATPGANPNRPATSGSGAMSPPARSQQ